MQNKIKLFKSTKCACMCLFFVTVAIGVASTAKLLPENKKNCVYI